MINLTPKDDILWGYLFAKRSVNNNDESLWERGFGGKPSL
jgi:hypothetical protein